ncbi:19287_t:CDS:1, partial [Gigaspora margarita]
YLEQERKNYPELDQYIKNKEWDDQQYLNTKKDYMEVIKEKERNEETEKILRKNELINTWEIIKSEPWTNFDTYEKYITQAEKQSAIQISKAREYFAKELIRIIVKIGNMNIQENNLKKQKKI